MIAAVSIARAGAPGAPFDQQEAARLEAVLYRSGFEGRRVVACVPDGKLVTAVLELPPRTSGAPLDQLARVELARVHKLEPGAFELACWDLPAPARAGDATHMMAAACPNADADTLLDAIESVGLHVIALDIKPWALTRACAPVSSGDGTTVLLDVGEEGAMLTAVRQGAPVYERMMRDAGTASLRGRFQSELALEPAVADFLFDSLQREAHQGDDAGARESGLRLAREHVDHLREEVASALDYIAHRYPGRVSLLALTGQGAAIPGLAQCLARGAEHEVRSVAPADLTSCPQTLPHGRDCALTNALGLALYPTGRAA
jgi:Tfp pilus assembly PilM family ATPase